MENSKVRFKNESYLYEINNNENRLILIEFRPNPIKGNNKSNNNLMKYIIWLYGKMEKILWD